MESSFEIGDRGGRRFSISKGREVGIRGRTRVSRLFGVIGVDELLEELGRVELGWASGCEF